MPKPMITIHDVETGEVIEREMTADEIAQKEADKAIAIARQQEELKAAADKAALLTKLGITESEAVLLLS